VVDCSDRLNNTPHGGSAVRCNEFVEQCKCSRLCRTGRISSLNLGLILVVSREGVSACIGLSSENQA